MRKQKGLANKAADAEPLNLAPKRHRHLARQGNRGAAVPCDHALSGDAGQRQRVRRHADADRRGAPHRQWWYLFADPALIDTIEYAYLDGEEGLYTESRLGFDVDGVEIKGRLDFAAKAIDYRGMFHLLIDGLAQRRRPVFRFTVFSESENP
jgi:hypothetical protein